jgi:hypothetical protein
MSFNIEVDGGSSVRLPTAGKYCDRDIVITAKGGGGDINAFIDRSITEVNIPEGVTKIGDFAFRSCTKLTSVTLPSTLKTIGSSAFYSTKITTLDVPNGVTTINSNAYTSCTSLTTVFLPSKKENICILFKMCYPKEVSCLQRLSFPVKMRFFI